MVDSAATPVRILPDFVLHDKGHRQESGVTPCIMDFSRWSGGFEATLCVRNAAAACCHPAGARGASPSSRCAERVSGRGGRADMDTEALLAEVGSHCSSVVICRASPSQKAAVVGMMKQWELRQAGGLGRGPLAWWRRKRFRLAVGTPRPPRPAPRTTLPQEASYVL